MYIGHYVFTLMDVEVNFSQNVLKCQSLESLQVAYLAVGEVFIEHPRNNVGNIRSQRMADASVNGLFSDFIKGHGSGLENV